MGTFDTAFPWLDREPEWKWKPMERMESSIQNSFGSLWGAASAIADVAGLDKASDWAANRSAELLEKAADHDLQNTNFSDISSPIEAGQYAVELITNQVPDLVLMVAGGLGAGSLASKVATKSGAATKAVETMLHKGFTKNLKNVIKEVGADVGKDKLYKEAIRRTARDTGALIGVVGFEGAQGTGSEYIQNDRQDPLGAIGVGIAQAAIAAFNPVNKVLAGKLPKGKGSFLAMTGGEAAEEMGQEIPAMMYEAGLDPNRTFGEILSSDEGINRLIESGVGGALLGSVFGGGTHLINKSKAQVQVQEKPTWEENLKKIIAERPEVILEEAQIDTSEDAHDPIEGLQVGEDTSDQSSTQGPIEPQWKQPVYQERAKLNRKVENYQPELPSEIVKKIEGSKKPLEPQWKTDPQIKRSARAAKAIEAIDWDNPHEPTTLVEKNKENEAAKSIRVFKETKVIPDNVRVYEEPSEPISVKDSDKSISVKDSDKSIRVKESSEPNSAKGSRGSVIVRDSGESISVKEPDKSISVKEPSDNSTYQVVKERKVGDWTSSTYKVDGEDVSTYSKDNFKVVKFSKKKWKLVQDDNGAIDDFGVFKTLTDAKEAARVGKRSEDFYVKKETKKEVRKKQPLNERQKDLLKSLDFKDITSLVEQKTGAFNEPNSEDVIVESLIDSARTYDPDNKTTFKSYAVGRAIGAIKDSRKNVPTTSFGENDAILRNATKESVSTIYTKPKEVKKKEKPPEVKNVKVSKEEEAEILKRVKAKRDKKSNLNPASINEKTIKSKIAHRDEFLSKVTTAEDLSKYSEAMEVAGEKHDANLKEIVKFISTHSRGKLSKVKVRDAKDLKKHNKSLFNSLQKKGGVPLAFHFGDSIYLNKKALARLKNSEVIYAHEILHSVTTKELLNNPGVRYSIDQMLKKARESMLTKDELAILDNMDSVDFIRNQAELKKRLNRYDIHTYYALLNPFEFLAEAFTNVKFQKELQKIKVDKPDGIIKTLWDKFVSKIRSIFNINSEYHTLLDDVITTGARLMKTDISTNKVQIDPALTATDRAAQLKIMMERDVRDKPKDLSLQWINKAAGVLKDAGKGVTERLRKIDYTLIKPLREMEFKILTSNRAYQDRIKPFVDGYRKLSKEDKLLLDLTLINREKEDIEVRNEILERNNLTKSYKQVEEVLKEIFKKKADVGLNYYKEMPDYFPRRVKDVRSLMQEIKEDPNYNIIQQELDMLPEGSDKEAAIQQMISTGRFPTIALLDPTSSKRRSIRRVSSKWKHHYLNSVDALVNHIYESNEAVYARELFGDNHRKKLVKERDKLYKELESEKVKGRKRKVVKLQILEKELEDFDGEFNEGISKMLVEKAPNLTASQADAVIRLIRSRLTQKGMHGPLSTVRNLSLMSVLASPTSAITQIGDLAFSIYKYGPKSTVKAILGDKLITPRDLDLSHSMKEFQSEGTAKWLDKTLRWSGLQFMDNFGKTTTMNASIYRARELTLGEFKKEYGDYYGEDTERLYRDLKDKKNTELTKFFAFNELSDLQPISMSEMPLMYLTAGNGRIFYALKSFNIKALNTIYRESIHKWRVAKTKKEKAEAAYNTGRLILLMTFAGATADELKDFLLAKDAGAFSDNVFNNLLKIAFLSRYTLDQGFSKGIAETLAKDVLVPPTGLVDDPLTDIVNTIKGEPDFKTINNLPWGKIPYSWLSIKEESSDMKKLRREILEEYGSGGALSSIKKRMNKYNKWARKTKKESIITLKVLTDKRKRVKKDL
jgi:hypothetical protein